VTAYRLNDDFTWAVEEIPNPAYREPGSFGAGATRMNVRDPSTRDVVEVTVFNRYLPQVIKALGRDGILDSAHIQRPGQRLDNLPPEEFPNWQIVRDGDETYLLPIVAGHSPDHALGRPGRSDPDQGYTPHAGDVAPLGWTPRTGAADGTAIEGLSPFPLLIPRGADPVDAAAPSGHAPGQRARWTTARVRNPVTGETIEVRVAPKHLRRVGRTAGEDGVIPMDAILTLGPRQAELPSGRLPKWVMAESPDGTPTLYPLARVGILGKRGLKGIDETVARDAAHAARQAYRIWARQTGANITGQHGNIIVLAAAGLPMVALAGEYGGVFMMAGMVPPGLRKLLNNLKGGTPNPASQTVQPATPSQPVAASGRPARPRSVEKALKLGRDTRRLFLTARRNLLYYAFVGVGLPAAAIPLVVTAGKAHINVKLPMLGQHSIPIPTKLDPTTIQFESYLDLIIRGVPLAVVAYTAARPQKLKWAGTKLKGLALRLVNGVTFSQNGGLALLFLGVTAPAPLPAKLSLMGFGLGQLILGGRTLKGAGQSRRFGNFIASAERHPGSIKTMGSPDISQKGRKLEDVAASHHIDRLVLATHNNPKINLTAYYRVQPGDTWVSVAANTPFSVSALRQFNPKLGHTLNPGEQVFYPTPKEENRLLRRSRWRMIPGGRRVRGDTIDLPDPNNQTGTRLLKSLKGMKWTNAGGQRGMSDVPLLILNRDAQLQALGQTNVQPLTFARSTTAGNRNWQQLAEHFGTSVEYLMAVNPALVRGLQPGDTVFYPRMKEITALRDEMGDTILLDSIKVPVPGAARFNTSVRYKVGRGENWTEVANKHSMSEAALKAMNSTLQSRSLKKGDNIAVGKHSWATAQKKIGVPAWALEVLNATHLYLAGKSAGKYKVRKGEDLTIIAENLGVPEDVLRTMNGFAPSQTVAAGQEIKAPTKIQIKADADVAWIEKTIRMHGASRLQSLRTTRLLNRGHLEREKTYTVPAGGKTWDEVAKDFSTTAVNVRNWNPKANSENPNFLPAGVKLTNIETVAVPQTADAQWLHGQLTAGGVNRRASLTRNLKHAEIQAAELRAPAYSWEADSHWQRWLQVAGSSGIALGSLTVLPTDWQRGGIFGRGVAPLDAGNAVSALATAGLAGAPNRNKGTLAKQHPVRLADAQIGAGSTLAMRALLRLIGLLTGKTP
jgi:LysM repeat protein